MGIKYITFGTQNLLPQTAYIGEELFSEQSVFAGIFTNYSITKDNAPASESDYTVVDGKLTFNALGEYVVTMTNPAIGYAAKVIAPIEVLPVHIKENSGANITVYPNPTKGEIHVQSSKFKVQSVEIFDVYGRKVFEHQTPLTVLWSYDLTVLPAGVYFVRVTTETGAVVKKIIKQ